MILKNAAVRCLRVFGTICAIIVIVFALLITIARLVIPAINQHNGYFEKWASSAMRQPVHIERVTAGWFGFEPALSFQNVVITDPSRRQSLLRIQQLSISINLFQSLLHWQLLPGHLSLSGVRLEMDETSDGQWQIKGISELKRYHQSSELSDMRNILLWMLTQSDVSLNDIDVNYRRPDGTVIPVKNLRLKVANGLLHHTVSGLAVLSQTIPTKFRFVLNIKNPNLDGKQFSADLYLHAKNVLFKQLLDEKFLQKYFTRLRITSGDSNVEAWVQWRDGRLQSLQGIVDAHHVGLVAKERKSILLNRFTANLYWQRFLDGFEFSADHVAWRSAGRSWPARSFGVRVINAEKQPTVLAYLGRISLAEVRGFAEETNYFQSIIPSCHINPELRLWFEQAFPAGEITNAVAQIQGPWDQFPFERGGGDFTAVLNYDHLTLNYAHQWPAIQNMRGVVSFHNNQLRIIAEHGEVDHNVLDHMQGVIPDLEKPELVATGHSTTDLTNGLEFLRQTPLDIAKGLDTLQTWGPMDLQLKLTVPLMHGKDGVVSEGNIAVPDGNLRITNWNTTLTNIQGQFHFLNGNLTANNVSAHEFGLPMTIDVSTLNPEGQSPVLQLNIGGHVAIAQLSQQYGIPVQKYFDGMSSYRALLKIRDDNSPLGNSLSIASDLSGVRVNLPSPYGKTADETRPLVMNLSLFRKKPLNVTLQYGDNLSAALTVDKKDNRSQLISGELHFGSGKAHLQTVPGLLITGQFDEINWDDWKNYFISKTARPLDAAIRSIELTIDQLKFNSYALSKVYLSLMRVTQAWNLTMQNSDVVGNLVIPDDHSKTWRGRFSRLYLPANKQTEQSIDPRRLPPLDVAINDFHYGDKTLGNIRLKTKPIDTGVQFENLSMVTPLMQVQAVGTWQYKQGEPQTTVFGQLSSRNLGTALKDWQVTQVLEGGEGTARFALEWPGSPQQFTAARLNGAVNIDFRDGRITQIADSASAELGFGRLLNLFSLQSLPKLPMNLVNLTKKGFAFDLLKGDFSIKNGAAKTENSSLVGSVAWVQIKGGVGFPQKTYDLQLQVVPNVTSSLPLIVGLTGGPIAGAITWVANKILAPHVGKAAEMDYRISGSWNKPDIVQLPKPQETAAAHDK